MFSLHVKYSLEYPYSTYSAMVIFTSVTNTKNIHFYTIKSIVH